MEVKMTVKFYPTWINDDLKKYISNSEHSIEIKNIDDYNSILFEYCKNNNNYKYYFNNFKFKYEFEHFYLDETSKLVLEEAKVENYLFSNILYFLLNINNKIDEFKEELKKFVTTNNIEEDFFYNNISLNEMEYLFKLRWFKICNDEEFLKDNQLFYSKLLFLENLVKNNKKEYWFFHKLLSFKKIQSVINCLKLMRKYNEYNLGIAYITILLEHTNNFDNFDLKELNDFYKEIEYYEDITNPSTSDKHMKLINEFKNKYKLNMNGDFYNEGIFRINFNAKSTLLYNQACDLITIYDNNHVIDYSAICLQFCRILEIQIKHIVLEPIIKKLGKKYISDCIEKYNISVDRKHQLKIDNIEKIELGKIRKLFECTLNNHENNEFFYEIYQLMHVKGLKSFIKILDQEILNYFRNPPAHTGLASRNITLCCKEYLEQALLCMVFNFNDDDFSAKIFTLEEIKNRVENINIK